MSLPSCSFSLQRAVSLLQLSERYAMHGLSLFCCEALSKNLTVDTVCKIAAVAEQHSLRDLKEKAVSCRSNSGRDRE